MTATTKPRPTLRRRWERFSLAAQGRVESENTDRVVPWAGAALVFTVMLALDAAALRSIEGGSGLTPWLQAAWRREHGFAGAPVGGMDPARAAGSFISEPILWVTRWVPPEAVFAVVQAAAIALAIVPLWRLARNQAHLRVGATAVVTTAFALAPTLQRANLTAFHPELIALPCLLWAYLHARQNHWKRYGALVLVILLCRADLGLTVTALGVLLVVNGKRRPGFITAAVGLIWSIGAVIVLDPAAPDRALTPAGEFVARAVTPLAVLPRVVLDPIMEIRELTAQPSVLFLVVVLSPLLFLPLVAPRSLIVAVPALMLAMIADRSVQRVAQQGVLDLSPAAAHIAPAMAFVFVALIFALERIGEPSVSRVNVDRRVLIALLAGASLLFLTEAPTSPYSQPWEWGSQDALDSSRIEASKLVAEDDAVAASPTTSALVAGRANLIELPPDSGDFTAFTVDRLARSSDAVLLDSTPINPQTGEPQWVAEDLELLTERFEDRGFDVTYRADGIYLFRRDSE